MFSEILIDLRFALAVDGNHLKAIFHPADFS